MPLTAPAEREELATVETRNEELVKPSLPRTQGGALAEAIEYFSIQGQTRRSSSSIPPQGHAGALKLRDRAITTTVSWYPQRLLRWLALTPMGDGFALWFPRRHAPNQLPPWRSRSSWPPSAKYTTGWCDWASRTRCVEPAIQNDRVSELILISEASTSIALPRLPSFVMERAKEAASSWWLGRPLLAKQPSPNASPFNSLPKAFRRTPSSWTTTFLDRDKTPRTRRAPTSLKPRRA